MKKNLVLTIAVGDFYQQLAQLSHPTLAAYAKKIDADFMSIDEPKISLTTPHWEKFQISELLKSYDRIIYLDTDLIVRPDTPNILDEVPYFKMGMFDESLYTEDRASSLKQACFDYDFHDVEWNGHYYNTGVMVLSRVHRDIFVKPEKENHNFFEQSYINAKILQTNTEVQSLKYWFNRMSCIDKWIGEERHSSYIIHYAGFPNPQMLPQMMFKDLQRWEECRPHYSYKRHIYVNVQGGLGDQISAEPAIRFMLKNIYPEDDVRLSTHFPKIFDHLDIPVSKHGEMQYTCNSRPWECITLPGPETPQWAIVSNLLTHTTDFCSMALLKRTLPDEDKTFKLQIDEKDLQEVVDIFPEGTDIDNLVLIHPGRHWESKTFPKEWWQTVIDGISELGYQVCLIGRDTPGDDGEFDGGGARGTVDVEAKGEILDTRNLLSLGGLIALISRAKICLSNDSAPIHIAGAFDNWIILIPTCKHPDHIMPYRNGGDKYYKGYALYKKLTLDDFPSAPTVMYEVTADKVQGDFYDYLPETQDVIDTVEIIFAKEQPCLS